MNPGIETPVLLLGFNRPDLLSGLINILRGIRPMRVYVALDGPRAHKPGDHEGCQAVRDVVATEIDWPCELYVHASPVNQGCRLAVSNGIRWFFEQVPEGIVLEDDCWPTQDFFDFCEAMLARYRNDSRVAMVSGNNFQQGEKRSKASYYFSKYTHIWGWASWRRAWQQYDLELNGLDGFFESENWTRYQASERETKHWKSLLTKVRSGEIDTWDYQWNYTVWKMGALVVLPNVNLVSNQGFRSDATHTLAENSPLAAAATFPLGKLKLLSGVEHNVQADQFTFETIFCPPKAGASKVEASKSAAQEKKAAKVERRAAEELAALKSSLSWRLLGKHVHSVEKRLRKVFGG